MSDETTYSTPGGELAMIMKATWSPAAAKPFLDKIEVLKETVVYQANKHRLLYELYAETRDEARLLKEKLEVAERQIKFMEENPPKFEIALAVPSEEKPVEDPGS